MRFSHLAFLLSCSAAVNAQDDFQHFPDQVCLATCTGVGSAEVCTFNFKLNQFASELGYYTVDGCKGIMPVLGMKQDVQYRFIQQDETNYYHPLGFAYFADGAHDGVDELEPSIPPAGSTSTCGSTNTCPAPMYLRGGNYLGVFSNIAEISPILGDEDFGLDVYEPEFFVNPVDWLGAGTYEVALKFDVSDFTADIFYFCHIHQFMTGRIKFVDPVTNIVLQVANEPAIPYPYEMATAYDQSCGTFGTEMFQLPNAQCPSEFVCNEPAGVSAFAGCVDSMNCAMTAGMTTNASSDDARALFVHQMIPHHQNAVNMAKALLNSGSLSGCTDLATQESADCTLKQICLEIITAQNHQIQSMRGANEELNYIASDDCTVIVGEAENFNVRSAQQVGGVDFCLDYDTNRATLQPCNGSLRQVWSINTNGALQSNRGRCLVTAGKNIRVKSCFGLDMTTITQTLSGALLAPFMDAIMAITPVGSFGNGLGNDGIRLMLQTPVAGAANQRFIMDGVVTGTTAGDEADGTSAGDEAD